MTEGSQFYNDTNIMDSIDSNLMQEIGPAAFKLISNSKGIFNGKGEMTAFMVKLLEPLHKIQGAYDIKKSGNIPGSFKAPTMLDGFGLGGPNKG